MQDAARGHDTRVYAGFLRRAAAYFADSILLILPSILIELALGRENGGWSSLLQVVMTWLYTAGLESGPMQATLGKRLLGIQVTDLAGNRISFARASGRFFGIFLSTIILGIGLLMAAFTKRKQALHDMMASCLVVRAGATPEEIAHASGTMPMSLGAWVGATLVIFIPVLGIVAAVALPAYQDYVIRAKMMEVVSEAARWKESARSAFDDYARNPVSEAVIEEPASSKYVSRVLIHKPERRIEVDLASGPLRAPLVTAGARVDLTFQGPDGWSCTAHGVPARYLPPACRH